METEHNGFKNHCTNMAYITLSNEASVYNYFKCYQTLSRAYLRAVYLSNPYTAGQRRSVDYGQIQDTLIKQWDHCLKEETEPKPTAKHSPKKRYELRVKHDSDKYETVKLKSDSIKECIKKAKFIHNAHKDCVKTFPIPACRCIDHKTKRDFIIN